MSAMQAARARKIACTKRLLIGSRRLDATSRSNKNAGRTRNDPYTSRGTSPGMRRRAARPAGGVVVDRRRPVLPEPDDQAGGAVLGGLGRRHHGAANDGKA